MSGITAYQDSETKNLNVIFNSTLFLFLLHPIDQLTKTSWFLDLKHCEILLQMLQLFRFFSGLNGLSQVLSLASLLNPTSHIAEP